jgi:hypothetical protein
MKFIEIQDPKELPGSIYLRMWTTREEVETNHPDVDIVYVYTPIGGISSYYYVPVSE